MRSEGSGDHAFRDYCEFAASTGPNCIRWGALQQRRFAANRYLKTFAIVTAASPALVVTKTAVSQSTKKWIAFYGQTADEELLASYDIVILDRMFKGSIDAVAKSGACVCGYLSLGEINASDSFYGRVDPAALLEENPAWPRTRRVRHQTSFLESVDTRGDYSGD